LNQEVSNKPGKTDYFIRYAAAAMLAYGAVKLLFKGWGSAYDTLTDEY